MDRFIVREPRTSAEYPQGNQLMAYPANAAAGTNMIPETMYFGGPFASEFPNSHRLNVPQNMNAQLMNEQHHAMLVHNNMNAHQRNINNNINAQSNTNAQPHMNIQPNMNVQPLPQANINAQHNTSYAQINIGAPNMNPQMAQNFGQNPMAGPGVGSGIDPRYLAEYADSRAQFIVSGQQIHRHGTPINGFGADYQNRGFSGIDRNKQNSFASHVSIAKPPRVDQMPKPEQRQIIATKRMDDQNLQKTNPGLPPPLKKPNELDLLKSETQNQILTRADRIKALHRSGPRVFSGPVENVLKWHKSLQDIGVLIFYEIVAKCVSVRPGERCSKNLVVRDDSGPAMQVVYYEIDFLLPELKPPCTIRVLGRMMAGTCRLQAFNVRPATGDDVATLPRRAAVAAHHVAKLCKEYGPNAHP